MKKVFIACVTIAVMTACASGASGQAAKAPPAGHDASGLPTIDATFSIFSTSSDSFKREHIPPELATFIHSLPEGALSFPPNLLEKILTQEFMAVARVPGFGTAPDMLAGTPRGTRQEHTLLVRSFHGKDPSVTGYLLQAYINCRDLREYGTAAEIATYQSRCPPANDRDESRTRVGNGLRFYVATDGQPPRDVTATLDNPMDLVSATELARYAKQWVSEPIGDTSRLDMAPTLRWIMETDPERPLRKHDPRAFAKGTLAHVGFVIWNGERFESRKTVPAAYWPCRPLELKYGDCSPPPTADDRFVTADPR